MGLLQMLVKLGLDATGYEAGLKRSRSAAKEFGSELAGELGSKIAGVFSLAALEEGMRKTVEFGSKIQDLSTRTGISTDDLQIFDFAAQKAGTTLESVTGAVEKLGISMAKAKAAGPESDIFKALQRQGLSAEQIATLDAAEAFRVLGDHIKNVSEITGALQADMKETMGKGALEVLAVLREDVRATGDELRNMGGIIPPETIAQLDQFDDDLKAAWVQIRSFFADIFNMAASVVHGFVTMSAAIINAVNELVHLRNPVSGFMDVIQSESDKAAAEAEKREADRKKKKLHPELDDEAQKRREKKAQEDAQRDEERGLRESERIMERVEKKKRERDMEGMTDAEKLKRINAEMDEAWKQSIEGNSALERAKAQERFEDLDEERRKTEKHMETQQKKASTDLTLRAQSDSLISIGNILGVDPNRPVVDKLDTIHLVLQKIESNTSGSPGQVGSNQTYPSS